MRSAGILRTIVLATFLLPLLATGQSLTPLNPWTPLEYFPSKAVLIEWDFNRLYTSIPAQVPAQICADHNLAGINCNAIIGWKRSSQCVSMQVVTAELNRINMRALSMITERQIH